MKRKSFIFEGEVEEEKMTVVLEKKKGKEKLSLVVPAYNEEETLPIFYR